MYLGFVVGIGFAFTENVQYGINIYSAATEWSKYNSSVHVSIRMDPTAGNFTVDREFSREEILVSELDVSSRIEDRQISSKRNEMFKCAFEGLCNLSLRTHCELLDQDTREGDEDASSQMCLMSYPYQTLARFRTTIDVLKHTLSARSFAENRRTNLTADLSPHKDMGTEASAPISLNFTLSKQPYTEAQKLQSAAAVTFGRGAFPLHSVWAGMTATRYVRNLWLDAQSLAAARSGQHRVDVLQCLGFSLFYHGAFDFVIMAAPALAFTTHSIFFYMACSAIAFSIMIVSAIHLCHLTRDLELDLVRAGWEPLHDGRGLPRLGFCTSRESWLSCCFALQCILCCCPASAKMDSVNDMDEP